MRPDKLVLALSIEERAKCRYNHGNVEPDFDKLEIWKKRKSLCTDELFSKALEINKISEEKIAVGLSDIKASEDYMINAVKDSEWYNIHKAVMGQKNAEAVMDLCYPLRFHKAYIEQRIKNILNDRKGEIQIVNPDAYENKIVLELTSICMKSIVADMHTLKSKIKFVGDNSQERFQFYMKERFGTADKIECFFEEYTVLARMLATRIVFHLNNLRFFIDSIVEKKNELHEKFGVNSFEIRFLSMGAGDSHSHGKSVLLFEIGQKKFAYKYKNLEVGEKFNQFVFRLKKYDPDLDFKVVRRIVGADYTIEECIEHEACNTMDEIRDFYYKFGEYIAIGYILCANDLHFENIIAAGKYPVIIDIETIIQNINPIDGEASAIKKVMYSSNETVLGTGLLPTGNLSDPKKTVRMSALDNGKQTLPFKVLKPTKELSDEMRYEYQEHQIDGAQNIPILNGEEVGYKEYEEEIINGMIHLLHIFYTNKQSIERDIKELFSNVIVRNVIKATQKYADMLEYGYHPSCTKDFVEREKLFENIWGYPYRNLEAVPYEISDLLVNDIPIFFNNTSSKDLIASSGEIIKNYYPITAIERIVQRIDALNLEIIEKQKNILVLALGMYDGSSENFEIKPVERGEKLISLAENIGDYILSKAVRGRDGTVSWADIITRDYTDWSYANLPINLYDGFSGLYLFFLQLSEITGKNKYKDILKILDKMLLKEGNPNIQSLNVYEGRLSCLYPLYQKLKITGENVYLGQVNYLFNSIDQSKEINTKEDWLTGKAGYLKVLINLYRHTKDSKILRRAEKCAKSIEIDNIHSTGFAHGYAGIAYALSELYLITHNDEYKRKFDECIRKENKLVNNSGTWLDLRETNDNNQVWCHGAAGIGLARLRMLHNGYADSDVLRENVNRAVSLVVNQELQNDCLCHGTTGTADFLYEVCKSDFVDKEYKALARAKLEQMLEKFFNYNYVVRGMKEMPNLGLMVGLSGIGYEFLRFCSMDVPNVLLLD